MKMASGIAFAAALMIGSGAVSAPAAAQKKGKAAAEPAQWAPKLSKEEVVALQPLEKAVGAKDWAAAKAALPAAEAAAKGADARFFVGQFQVAIAAGTNDAQLQSRGLDAMIASGGGDPTRMASLHRAQAQIALQAQDFAKADAALARLSQLSPNDPDVAALTAETKFRQKKPAEALPLFQKAIQAYEAAGKPVPEALHLFALQSAVDAKMGPQALALSKFVVTKYPNQKNWRNALLLYRQNSNPQGPALLDMMRLMRATKAMDTSDDYLLLADLLARGRFYAEARSTLDEAFAAGKLPRANADAAAILKEVTPRIGEDRTALAGLEPRARSAANGEMALRLAEGYYGHADYAKAVEFYRLALQKGGVDAALVNSRLGMALALSGQRPAAEEALKSVTGPRSTLASYWLLWLSQRA